MVAARRTPAAGWFCSEPRVNAPQVLILLVQAQAAAAASWPSAEQTLLSALAAMSHHCCYRTINAASQWAGNVTAQEAKQALTQGVASAVRYAREIGDDTGWRQRLAQIPDPSTEKQWQDCLAKVRYPSTEAQSQEAGQLQ